MRGRRGEKKDNDKEEDEYEEKRVRERTAEEQERGRWGGERRKQE